MRFGFTEDQQQFRAQVRTVLRSAEVQAAAAAATGSCGIEPDARPLYRLLGERGLLAVHWPVRYGGAGRSPTDAAIVAEELVRAGVPDTLHVNTVQIVGQFLLMAGSDEQKRRHLPAIACGESFASVLYTEPDAGSDLGALRAVAEHDGDGYRITGTKVFSLKTRFVDLGLCAARTTPGAGKYQGISLFLVDMSAPGVTVSVIPGIGDEHFHRVDLDAVAVPAGNLLGTRDEGWPLLNEALAIERTGLDYYLKAEHWLDAALDVLAQSGPAALPGDRLEQLGRWHGELAADHVLAWEVLTGIAAEQVDQIAAAVAKYHSSELARSVAAWAAALPDPGQRADRSRAAMTLDSAYREAPGLTLSAGTSEVMLQIVAASFDSLRESTEADLTPDPLAVQLRTALRTGLAGVPARMELHGAPVTDGAGGPTRPVLDALEALAFERPAAADGLDLGLTTGALVSEELGRAARGNPYRADAFAADLGCPAGAALAGLEALPAGGAVVATPRRGGWELTGAAVVDDVSAAMFLVAARNAGVPVLVAVARGTAGVTTEDGCWPPVVRFAATPVAAADVVGTLDESPTGPLARARVRQAAYLLGIAGGAHDAAVAYAGFRRQFGTRLRDLPAVSIPLARALVALRATRAAVYRAAWLVDHEPAGTGTAPLAALAMAGETARDVVRLSMQSCGVRALTSELGLHRYFRLTAAESTRYGDPAALWRAVGADCVRTARCAAAGAEPPVAAPAVP
ncbi:acyl-CoA dehydrogenase family protein [Micromonospora halophytica]|uniref:Acyl-CoA dehydrogenase n=1 Tax=Micromonospora halophytica TaxID=47864 RepID=A0A1C5JFI7_9ACTN|nr:acyl-CoA dehydrogenase family protein [Micromonospora halophytica]SCG69327.1 Acyl-CoA dehydrogenase [Micromonospora halophytica]